MNTDAMSKPEHYRQSLTWRDELSATARRLIAEAGKAGADAVQVCCSRADSMSHTIRNNETENIDRSDQVDIGITVFKGGKNATVNGNQLSAGALRIQIEKAVMMADVSPVDPTYTLTPAAELAAAQHALEKSDPEKRPALDQFDMRPTNDQELAGLARILERSAIGIDGVKQSEGATAAYWRAVSVLATSEGLEIADLATGYRYGVTVIAERDGLMEVEGDAVSKCHWQDLPSPEAFGRRVGQRAVAALGGKKLATGQYEIVFDHDMSRSLLGVFLQAINGQTVARGSSFLRNALDEPLFPATIVIEENPFIPRSGRSRLRDAEGLLCQPAPLVQDGRLSRFLHTRETAAQLKQRPFGNAAAAGGRPVPQASNVIVKAGSLTFDDFIKDIHRGVYVTSQMGMGINLVTGDYSQGVSGFAIRDGQLAEPAREITIAGHLREMFARLSVDAESAEKSGLRVPHFRVGTMTVAGSGLQ